MTAVLLAGGIPAARGAASLEQMLEIERLIDGGNCTALRSYLVANPTVTAGDDALAQELRDFLNRTSSGLLECLSTRKAGGLDGFFTLPEPRQSAHY